MFSTIGRKLALIVLAAALALGACSGPAAQPTQTPTPLPTAALTPDIAQILAVTPEPTPPPEIRIAEADLALSFGDYERAMALYQAVTAQDGAEAMAAGLYGQGLTLLKQGNTAEAAARFEQTLNQYPTAPAAARANFWLGSLAKDSDDYAKAISYYQAYLNNRPGILESEVYMRIGDLYAANADQALALQAYQNAYLGSEDQADYQLARKLAEAYSQAGEREKALAIFDEQYQKTENVYVKAMMDLLAGQMLLKDPGTQNAGYEKLQDAVDNFPQTYDAYTALTILLDANQPVDELQRGLINYNRSQPDLAIEAFDRYLAGEGTAKDKALYYKALAQRAVGINKAPLGSEARSQWALQGGSPEDKEAIATWDTILNDYSQSNYVRDAVEDIVYTQYAYMGQTQLAVDTSLSYVARYPQADFAPSMLFNAGRWLEVEGRLDEAAALWMRAAQEYPSADNAFQSLFFAGILYFRAGDSTRAADALNRAVLVADSPLEYGGAYLWLGKLAAQAGENEKASEMWRTATSNDPNGYYGLRAEELNTGNPAFSAIPNALNLDVNLAPLRNAAADWMMHSFSLPVGTNTDYSSTLWADGRLKRALEYHALGLYDSAATEFESLRNANRNNVLNLFRLMKLFRDYGYYKSAIESSKAITQLAGFTDNPFSPSFPAYFAYMTYGAYYLHWIVAAAEKHDLPVLVLLSLIHQESHFESFATSSAGANGLMQIMPPTGQQMADELGWPPNYQSSDLYLPFINLELGSTYLARQFQYFDGDAYAALAAYNGGPGNAITWKRLSGDDPDLFVGSIRYLESRTYIRRIAENYFRYARLYGNPVNPQPATPAMP